MKFLEASAGGGLAAALTRTDKLERLARAFDQCKNQKFSTFSGVEHRPMEDLDREQRPVIGHMASTLTAAGVPAEAKLSSVMKAAELDVNQANYLLCYCHNGNDTTGATMADRLRKLQDPKFIPSIEAWRDH